jgi:hypothetical protein
MTMLQQPPLPLTNHLTHCSACGAKLVGPNPLYRSLYACSIRCEDAIDEMYRHSEPDPVTKLVDDWCARLPRQLREATIKEG